MIIIGQPSSYDDMLKRIFYMSLLTGLCCTIGLAYISPNFKEFAECLTVEAEIGPLKNIKAIYVLIPLAIALLSRVFLLHDKLQKIFSLRERFEKKHILIPLAHKVCFNTDSNKMLWIRANRTKLMYQAFYPYASFRDPVIDRQLVFTAADQWGWFWGVMESSFILLIAWIIFLVLSAWIALLVVTMVLLMFFCFMFYQWPNLVKSASAQIEAIALDRDRREAVLLVFKKLTLSED